MTALAAVARRRSYSSVTDDAPSHEELLGLVRAISSVADHSALRPWRLIELRGKAREKLGKAIGKAEHSSPSAKPLRAPLLIAVVARISKDKIPAWEQEAVASGVAHLLSLVLDDAGWGVIWRTGGYTRAKAVHKMHKLEKNEYLLGWLYVGGKPAKERSAKVRKIDPEHMLSEL